MLVAVRGDKVRAVLIDLDRATLKAPLSQGVQDAMLVRMARYLHRHANLEDVFLKLTGRELRD